MLQKGWRGWLGCTLCWPQMQVPCGVWQQGFTRAEGCLTPRHVGYEAVGTVFGGTAFARHDGRRAKAVLSSFNDKTVDVLLR